MSPEAAAGVVASETLVEGDGIRITFDAIEELDADGGRLVSVRREDVVKLRIERGAVAERPLLSALGGLVLGAAGLWAGVSIALNVRAGELVGRRVVYLLVAAAMALLTSVVLLRHALGRGAFVAVTLRSGSRKLGFRSSVSQTTLDQFQSALQHSQHWSRLVG